MKFSDFPEKTETADQDINRAIIGAQTEEFLQAGNKIEVIPRGVGGDSYTPKR